MFQIYLLLQEAWRALSEQERKNTAVILNQTVKTVEGFWPSLLYNAAAVHWGLQHLFINRSPKVPPQHLTQAEVGLWLDHYNTLTLFFFRHSDLKNKPKLPPSTSVTSYLLTVGIKCLYWYAVWTYGTFTSNKIDISIDYFPLWIIVLTDSKLWP